MTENGVAEGYTVSADNSYTSVGGENTASDANGNLAAAKGGVYLYDAQNRLVSASLSGTTTTFGYDPRNRVVKRSVNGTERFLAYSGWDLIEERDSGGELRALYVHGAVTDELRRIELAACYAHARRKLIEAQEQAPRIVGWLLRQIGHLRD